MLALFYAGQASAQMSDDQVIDFVTKENASGKNQMQIGQALMARGVTREQLMRIREKYMQNGGAAGGASQTTSSESGDRFREANGEVFDFDMEALTVEDDLLGGETKKIYGHDIFRSKDLSFEPPMNIPTPADYVLGPGDELMVDIYGTSQSSEKYKISPEGVITLKNVGPIHVSGLRVEQAQKKICDKIGSHYQGSTIQATVGQTRTVMVNIMGEVKVPGTYTLSAFSTVFNALYMAGGVTDLGTLRNIKVSRNGRIISTIDVYEYILNGKLSGNVMLQDNDVILVGTYESLVCMDGCVKRPMLYEIKKGETLKSVLEYSGGLTSKALKNKLRIDRIAENGTSVFTVDEWDFASFILEDGDTVRASNSNIRPQNTVYVSGSVFYPGAYQLDNKTNSVKGLIEQAGGLSEMVLRSRAVLHRMKENRTRSAISVDLANIVDGNAPDLILQNEDSLVVGSIRNLLIGKGVQILGEVNYGGNYAYSDGMTVQDLVAQAGGFKEAAAINDVEITRSLMYLTEEEKEGLKDPLCKIFHISLERDVPVNGQDFVLKPNDIVTVHMIPDYQEPYCVSVLGEIVFAGPYMMEGKNDRFSSIIKRAGGLSSMASIDDISILRTITDDERERKEQLLKLATSGSDSTNSKKLEVGDKYVVGLNARKALENPGSVDDIVLRAGDVIRIPRYNNVVSINGEVLNPNAVNYVKGKPVSYYINLAGGYTQNALKKKAYIIYPNGKASRASKGKVQPGCEIVVPTENKRPDRSVQTVSLIVSMAGVLATIGAVLISVFK